MTCRWVGQGLSKEDVAAMFAGLPGLRDRVPKLLKICLAQKKNRLSEAEKEGWEELCLRCEKHFIELLLEEHEVNL